MEEIFKALTQHLNKQGFHATKYDSATMIKIQVPTLIGVIYITHNANYNAPTEITIETSQYHNKQANPPPIFINLADPDALKTIVKKILEYFPHAKSTPTTST